MHTKDEQVINITIHGWILALVGLAILLAIIAFSADAARGAVLPEPAGESAVSVPGSEVIAASSGTGRRFYVTFSRYNSNQVLTACSSGYHFASLWELYDVSNLVYSYDHPDAAGWSSGDQGFGPPAQWNGWIRTGYISSIENVPGKANCANWTSTTSGQYGSIIRLQNIWNTPTNMGSWLVDVQACNYDLYVWCVED